MTAGSKEQSKARHRRLQRLQLTAVVVPTIAILVASIFMARGVVNAGDDRRSLQDANRKLVASRHATQLLVSRYWQDRAVNGASPGVPSDIQQRFMRDVGPFQELVKSRRDFADERPLIDRVQKSLSDLSALVLSGIIADAPGKTQQTAEIRRAQTLVNELDLELTEWVGVIDNKLDRESRAADQLIAKLLVGLGILIALLVGVATAMWVAIDRKRRAAIAEVQTERDANAAVMASVQDGLAVLDDGGAILQANDRVVELTGCPSRSSRDAWHPGSVMFPSTSRARPTSW